MHLPLATGKVEMGNSPGSLVLGHPPLQGRGTPPAKEPQPWHRSGVLHPCQPAGLRSQEAVSGLSQAAAGDTAPTSAPSADLQSCAAAPGTAPPGLGWGLPLFLEHRQDQEQSPAAVRGGRAASCGRRRANALLAFQKTEKVIWTMRALLARPWHMDSEHVWRGRWYRNGERACPSPREPTPPLPQQSRLGTGGALGLGRAFHWEMLASHWEILK